MVAVTSLPLSCFVLRRRFPWNIILLSIFVSRLALVQGGPGGSPMALQLLRWAGGDRRTRGQVDSPLSSPLSPTDAGHGADDRHDCQVRPGDPMVIGSGGPSCPPQCSQLNRDAARSQGMLQFLGLRDHGAPVLDWGCGGGSPAPLWQEDAEVRGDFLCLQHVPNESCPDCHAHHRHCGHCCDHLLLPDQGKERDAPYSALCGPGVGSWSVGTPWPLL